MLSKWTIALVLPFLSISAIAQSAVTGDRFCAPNLCVTVVLEGSVETYALTSNASVSALGWMAIGFGAQMVGSPMVIVWRNADGSITLSQRQASALAEPTVQKNPPRVATFSSGNSTATMNVTTIAFSLPHTKDTTTLSMIYAFSSTPPSSPAVDATIVEHEVSGTFTLNLGGALPPFTNGMIPVTVPKGTSATPPNGSSGNNNNGGSSGPFLPYQKKIIAHAALSSFGFIVVLPIGILIARYRFINPYWRKLHMLFQVAIGGLLNIFGFALGVSVVSQSHMNHFSDIHKRVGLALFIAFWSQVFLGFIINLLKPPNPRPRPLQNYFHALLGLSIMGLAFFNVHQGYAVEWPKVTGRGNVPKAVGITWLVWIIFVPVVYILGVLIFAPKERKVEKEQIEEYVKRKSLLREEESREGASVPE